MFEHQIQQFVCFKYLSFSFSSGTSIILNMTMTINCIVQYKEIYMEFQYQDKQVYKYSLQSFNTYLISI